MIFSRAYILKIANPLPKNFIDLLNEALPTYKYEDPEQHTENSCGFIEPVDGDSLLYQGKDKILLCFQTGKRELPAKEVNQQLNERVAAIESEQCRKVGKLERAELKEQISKELLPRCFIKRTKCYGYIDIDNSLFIMNTYADSHSELFNSYMRKVLSSWPVLPIQGNANSSLIMTNWIREKEAIGFSFGDSVKLVKPSSKSTASFKKHEITSEVVTSLIDNDGARVKDIELVLEGKLSFILTDEFIVKSVRYENILFEGGDDIPKDDLYGKFEADFLISSNEISNLATKLIAIFETD